MGAASGQPSEGVSVRRLMSRNPQIAREALGVVGLENR